MSTPYETTRHRCDYCRRSYAAKHAANKHEASCWRNPASRACLTCAHYDADAGMYEERCAKGIGEWVYGIDPEDPGCYQIATSCPGWESRP
jgi:hypothetical protein